MSSGALADYCGPGNFLALDFASTDAKITKIKVGLEPSVSSGLVELDSDMDAACKVTNKDVQTLVVQFTDGDTVVTERYNLAGLTCETS